MRKILIIGSSYSIKETFSKKFKNQEVYFSSFRNTWHNRDIKFYDLIVLSGYHHFILKKDINQLSEYINDYCEFVFFLREKTDCLLLLSTYIPRKISFSRVAFFYRGTIGKLLNKKKINILIFKKILDTRNRHNLLIKILKKIGLKFTIQKDLAYFTENFYLKNLPSPKFYFIKIKRPLIIERILRLFDFD